MKEGDKIYCKKSKKNITNDAVIEKGKYYTIYNIEKDSIIMETELYLCRFILNNHIYINGNIFYEFEKYFRTEKETRKEKLKKLKFIR